MKPADKKRLEQNITPDLFPEEIRQEMDSLLEQEARQKKRFRNKWLVGAACCAVSAAMLFSVFITPRVNAEEQVMQRVAEMQEVIQSGDLPCYIISSPDVRFEGRESVADFGYDKSIYDYNGESIFLFEQDDIPTGYMESDSKPRAEGIAQTMDRKNVEYFIDQDGSTGIFKSEYGGQAKVFTITGPPMNEDIFIGIVNSITFIGTK
ncbi:hypothetical protein CE91St36_19720 [Christensenellaceae bacterium]|uniref:hypothetical protein n=1 Tax=Christensenella timonensis TaxID=1816678 RepID=UPI00082F22B3|nr:hypothetical protein [Christensenella timonensis]BDF59155.1 hypothetical protein CE91St36_19720 [Christensenellaceae bacterium]BDF61821.1 hypothetical protein CE91St37_19710 [Christensenellaceae bacterium]